MKARTPLLLKPSKAFDEPQITLGDLFVGVGAHTATAGNPGAESPKGNATAVENRLVASVVVRLVIVLESISFSHKFLITIMRIAMFGYKCKCNPRPRSKGSLTGEPITGKQQLAFDRRYIYQLVVPSLDKVLAVIVECIVLHLHLFRLVLVPGGTPHHIHPPHSPNCYLLLVLVAALSPLLLFLVECCLLSLLGVLLLL